MGSWRGGSVFRVASCVFLEQMKPDPPGPIYQTMVWSTPSCLFGAGGRHRSQAPRPCRWQCSLPRDCAARIRFLGGQRRPAAEAGRSRPLVRRSAAAPAKYRSRRHNNPMCDGPTPRSDRRLRVAGAFFVAALVDGRHAVRTCRTHLTSCISGGVAGDATAAGLQDARRRRPPMSSLHPRTRQAWTNSPRRRRGKAPTILNVIYHNRWRSQ